MHRRDESNYNIVITHNKGTEVKPYYVVTLKLNGGATITAKFANEDIMNVLHEIEFYKDAKTILTDWDHNESADPNGEIAGFAFYITEHYNPMSDIEQAVVGYDVVFYDQLGAPHPCSILVTDYD